MSIPPSPVAPTVQAAGDEPNLHAAIMNLPCNVPSGYPFGSELCAGVYRQGHRDARHAAAELVASRARPTVEAPAASDAKDAQRYRWLRSRTSGGYSMPGSPATFRLPDVKPVGNIMRGSVAQHLDEAIDAAMDVHQAASPCEKDFHADRALSASAPSAEG